MYTENGVNAIGIQDGLCQTNLVAFPEKGAVVGVIYLDFIKEFDSVPWVIVQLEKMGISMDGD